MSTTLAAGTVINDRYVVECTLGQGAMAMVYRVRHIQLNTLHAMKLLLMPSLAVQQRLMQEGRVQASLRHINVVSVTDVVEVEGSPALVMEYIEGPSLDELLSKHQISIEQASALGEGIIQGVAAAHDHGLIHRDLKPANVMLAVAGGGLTPKVTDFGLAKLLDGDAVRDMTATRSGIAMGTPAYMAPEQFRDAKSVDARADVFSIGAILYELACGERAFKGDNFLDVYQSVADGNYTPPQEINPDLPKEMAAAINGALTTHRDERIADCFALLNAWTGHTRGRALAASLDSSGPWDSSLMAKVSTLSSSGNLGASDVKVIKEGILSGIPSSTDTWSDLPGMNNPELHSENQNKPSSPQSTSKGQSSQGNTGVILGFGGLVVASLIGLGLFASGAFSPTSEPIISTKDSEEQPVVSTSTEDEQPAREDEPEPGTADVKPSEEENVPHPTPSKPKEVVKPAPRPTPSKDQSAEPIENPEPERPDDATGTEAQSEETTEAKPTEAPSTQKTNPLSPDKAWVTVKGDANRVWLRNSQGDFSEGELQPGSYKVVALFQGLAPMPVGDVSLKAGVKHTITCHRTLLRCIVR